MKILHISDIHIGNLIYDTVDELAFKISNEIGERIKEIYALDTIVVTGDIFDASKLKDINNKEELISQALKFFNILLCNLDKDGITINKENIIFTPGNHDIIRTDIEADFSIYIEFLKRFYGEEVYNNKYELYEREKDLNALISITKYEKEKIAIISLNSAYVVKDNTRKTQIEQAIEKCSDKELYEIFDTAEKSNINELRLKIKDKLLSKINDEYIDYGYISNEQLINLRRMLTNIREIESYNLIAIFHHHLQLFPEALGKGKNDISIMKNASEVISKLLKYNIKTILHGHKHMDLITPITNDEFINNSEKLIYAISAGSIGKKDITNRMFQIIEVFKKNNYGKKLKITKFKYNQDKCERQNPIEIPPKKIQTGISEGILQETLDNYDIEIFKDYVNNLKEIDKISNRNHIDKIIKFIENTIFTFDDIQRRVKENWKIAIIVLIITHYRINSYIKYQDSIDDIKKYLYKNLKILDIEEKYYIDICNFVEVSFLKNQKEYKNLISDSNIKYSEYTAFILASTLIIDIYMYLTEYSDSYFEHIEHKLNISVDINSFGKYIPEDKIVLFSTPDRREVNINLKCKNPSFHKVAIIIIKNIEDNINRYEKQFSNIGLKLYHIRTDVEREKYNQEDYNFEAYLPTLMGLLIGDNIYKQKEVFIRELIQNSYDAIMLRMKIDKGTKFDSKVTVEMRVENESEKERNQHKIPAKYIRIMDNGIGMNIHNIERYFTGIGRSYYTSTDFDELQKNNKMEYRAISNFGIGFLSCFMVAQEVDVSTRYYEGDSEVITVNIPNFDGCFFVNKEKIHKRVGTDITLYEKSNCQDDIMNFKLIDNYIEKTFVDFPLDICIEKNDDCKKTIQAFKYRKELINKINSGENIIIHAFIDEEANISYDKNNNLLNASYGIFIEFCDDSQDFIFRGEDNVTLLNSGILLNRISNRMKLFNAGSTCKILINFPPSLIQLDVSREEIVDYKKINNRNILEQKNNIMDILFNQILEKANKLQNSLYPIGQLENVLEFLYNNNYLVEKINEVEKLIPKIYVIATKTKIKLSLQKLRSRNYLFEFEFRTIGELLEKIMYVKDKKKQYSNFNRYNLDELFYRTRELRLIGSRNFDMDEIKYKNLSSELGEYFNKTVESLNIVNNINKDPNCIIIILKLFKNILYKFSYKDFDEVIEFTVKKDILSAINELICEIN